MFDLRSLYFSKLLETDRAFFLLDLYKVVDEEQLQQSKKLEDLITAKLIVVKATGKRYGFTKFKPSTKIFFPNLKTLKFKKITKGSYTQFNQKKFFIPTSITFKNNINFKRYKLLNFEERGLVTRSFSNFFNNNDLNSHQKRYRRFVKKYSYHKPQHKTSFKPSNESTNTTFSKRIPLRKLFNKTDNKIRDKKYYKSFEKAFGVVEKPINKSRNKLFRKAYYNNYNKAFNVNFNKSFYKKFKKPLFYDHLTGKFIKKNTQPLFS